MQWKAEKSHGITAESSISGLQSISASNSAGATWKDFSCHNKHYLMNVLQIFSSGYNELLLILNERLTRHTWSPLYLMSSFSLSTIYTCPSSVIQHISPECNQPSESIDDDVASLLL